MLTEQQIIELSLKHGGMLFDELMGDQCEVLFSKKNLVIFANALHAEFIKSLGEPKLYEYSVNGVHYHHVSEIPPDDAYDEGSLIKLYALPDDDKP